MRSIFDQYNEPENRLTHALVCCLKEDRLLLRSFVNSFAKPRPPGRHVLQVVEKTLPGENLDLRNVSRDFAYRVWVDS